ncbi:hypothetical protein CUR178_06178 [Leishmania enriettii]|uniref:Rtr1/RPAP2 family n=1 Tax=Leishmania enriettii TaxID=5663 RepID=A0A836KMS4_LEIEN|nr:hypothetical protein CUR178_06178 [Leishmania enriettii]
MSHSTTESAVKSCRGTSGGAWEAIIDKAVSSVAEYLASTTREFDPAAPFSQHMLRLMDRGTLRDTLVERNSNELCGCFGCGGKPRGLRDAASGALSFEWPHLSSLSASDAEGDDTTDEEAGGGAHRRGQGEVANGAAARLAEDQPDADAEEVVYEEDVYTAESFLLAERQHAMLKRMQRKKLMREQRAMRAAATSNGPASGGAVRPPPMGLSGTTPAASRVLRSGPIGANFSQRFCSPECEEMYASSILPRVSPYFAYDYSSVFGAITNLFPNLRVTALQQLAGAETCAAGLVKPLREAQQQQEGGALAEAAASVSRAGDALKPMQANVAFECSELVRRNPGRRVAKVAHNARGADAAAQMEAASSTPLLREVLEQMQVLQQVWNNEVVRSFSDTHLPRKATAAATAPSPARAATAVGHFRSAQAPMLCPPRPVLRGSLLLCDFIMNTSCAQTRRLFYAHYTRSRPALQRCLADAASPRAPVARSLFYSVSVDIVAELEKSVTAVSAAAATDGSVGSNALEAEDEGLRLDPLLQQQRRELFVSHIFSEDVTSTLSRLLFLDYAVLSNMAWSGVWFSDVPLCLPGGQQSSTCSLLRSLQFTFAIPAVLLQEASSTPEVLGLAMVLLVAAGCCSEGVWRGCMREEVAFDEVAEVIGLARDDIAAAVRSLMLGEEF